MSDEIVPSFYFDYQARLDSERANLLSILKQFDHKVKFMCDLKEAYEKYRRIDKELNERHRNDCLRDKDNILDETYVQLHKNVSDSRRPTKVVNFLMTVDTFMKLPAELKLGLLSDLGYIRKGEE